MVHPQTRQLTLVLVTALVLSACGKNNDPKVSELSSTPIANTSAPAATPEVSATTSTPSVKAFSVEEVPLTNAALPPFPLFSYPDKVPDNVKGKERKIDFDEAYVVAGSTLHKVEGRISLRNFSHSAAGMSALAVRRNYQQAVEDLGGVKVDQVKPTDPQLVGREGGKVEKVLEKLRLPDAGPRFEDRDIASYDAYLIRTAQGNTWVSLMNDSLNAWLMVVQEKPLKQTVKALTADSIATALNTDGHLALYLSFDTNKTTLQADSATVLSEVVKLMEADPKLRLRIEGHTDNVGGDASNQTLSAGRADSVKAALVARKIDAARLEAKGFGATRPFADNGSEEGRVKNRRVELVKL